MYDSTINLTEILNDRNRCPFCGGMSVTARRSKTQTIGNKFAFSHTINIETGSQTQYDVLDYAYSCKCDSCGIKYYNHGFNLHNIKFFDQMITKNQYPVDVNSDIYSEYTHLNELLKNINWEKGALACEVHKKSRIFSRKYSSLYHFFVIHKNLDILKMEMDFVKNPNDSWGELNFIKIGYVKKGENHHV